MIVIPISKIIEVRSTNKLLYECSYKAAKILSVNITIIKTSAQPVPYCVTVSVDREGKVYPVVNTYVTSDQTVNIISDYIGLKKHDRVLISSKPDGNVVAVASIDEYIEEESVLCRV